MLLGCNILIRVAFGLVLNETADTFPQLDHATDTVFRRDGDFHRVHEAVFPVVHLPVYKRIAEILHCGVGGDGFIFLLVQFLQLVGLDFRLQKLDGIGKLLGQIFPFAGFAGAVRPEPGGFHHHVAQNHLRVLHEIAVHADSVFICVQMNPILLQIGDVVALLQENDVAGHFRSGVPPEGVIRQADGPNEVGALGQIPADSGIFLVQSSLAGNERHNTAGPHLVQRLSKEIVVDEPVVLVIPLIQHLEIPKGDVADGYIKKAVGHLHGFKAVYGNTGVLVKLPRNAPGNGIQLHAIGFAARHVSRQKAQEIARAAGWLQDVALGKAHLSESLVDSPDNHGRRVKGGEGAGPGRRVFLRIQQGFQLLIVGAGFLKAVRKAAPAHIAGQDFLFFGRGQPFFSFDLLQSADGGSIGRVFLAGGAVAQGIIGDVKIMALVPGDLRGQSREGNALTPGALRRRRE